LTRAWKMAICIHVVDTMPRCASVRAREAPRADALTERFCRWYCNRNQREEPIEESSGHYVVRDGSLIIQNVEENDAGSYMCVASNSEGSETLEIRLTVSAPLSVHVQPTIQTVDLGKPAYLVIIRHRHRSIGEPAPYSSARLRARAISRGKMRQAARWQSRGASDSRDGVRSDAEWKIRIRANVLRAFPALRVRIRAVASTGSAREGLQTAADECREMNAHVAEINARARFGKFIAHTYLHGERERSLAAARGGDE